MAAVPPSLGPRVAAVIGQRLTPPGSDEPIKIFAFRLASQPESWSTSNVAGCDSSATERSGEQEGSVATVAKANSDVCNDFVSRGNEIKPGAGDENRTRVLSLGIR